MQSLVYSRKKLQNDYSLRQFLQMDSVLTIRENEFLSPSVFRVFSLRNELIHHLLIPSSFLFGLRNGMTIIIIPHKLINGTSITNKVILLNLRSGLMMHHLI